MSNIISLGRGAAVPDRIAISNGLTDVLIGVLVLAGSRLAAASYEKQLIVWLAEKDQSRVGMGTVGFDVCDMPWDKDNFAKSRSFILRAIEEAKARSGWELLDYAPNEELLFPCLDKLAELISRLEPENIRPEARREWLAAAEASDPVITGFPICQRHGVLLSCFGCQICNN